MSANETVDARPTKEFFIYMLTKDIKLLRSIVDLVDNSWDGALRVRGQTDVGNLSVRLELDGQQFRISDNCGGIPYDVAKRYAFRFGRPKGMPLTQHSVGQFGVGMKRSLFKLGKHFRVESKTPESHFVVEQDVDDWVERDGWEFVFSEVKHYDRKQSLSNCGTTITVSRLHESVRAEFRSEIFESQLKEGIEAAHQQSIEQGLSITLNKVPLSTSVIKLFQSAELKPAHRTVIYEDDSDAPVTVKLYAGIAESEPQSSGWDVFCNGRLTLEADGSLVTGWGEGNGTIIPRLHNQYARFRGYAFFDCDDASKLPWNTTKTGVDVDSPLYQTVRQKMVEMMRPVIDFLNSLDREKDVEPRHRYLTGAVKKAHQRKLPNIGESPSFIAPEPPLKKSKGPKMRHIQYYKPESDINEVKKSLNVTTLRDVGEMTFDYFHGLECE